MSPNNTLDLSNIISPETTTNTLTSEHSQNPMITSFSEPTTPTSTLKKKTTFASHDEHITTTVIHDDKSETNSLFSKTTSMQSLSSQTKLRIKTCCGVVKLNSMRLFSIVAMLVNSIAFIAIAAVVINSYTLQSSIDTDLLLWRGDLLSLSEKTRCAVQLTAYENRTGYFDQYLVNSNNVTQLLKLLKEEVPSSVYTLPDTNEPTKAMDDSILNYVLNGQPAPALSILLSNEYSKARSTYNTFVAGLLDYSNNLAESKNSYIFVSSIVNLCLVAVALVVVVPTVFIVFAMAIKKEGNASKKLKRATAFMLLDTMEDEKLKSKFKEFCKMEGNGLELFEFMEKTIQFARICEKQHELLDKVAKKNAQDADEQAIRDFEKEKYILAFEIFAEYLDEDIGEYPIVVSGMLHEALKERLDYFAIDEPETYLRENLFEDIQREVSLASLNDIHFKFKQFLLESRKAQVKVDK